jgi:peptidoglycan/xylan/chitin deacetylase (PgdA/CDA1 family)
MVEPGFSVSGWSCPSGARAAAALTFDFDAEEVWIGEDPDNACRPSVLSQGTYGAKVAVPLILDLLARHRIDATFFVPARVAESHPERVREIVDAGHELAHHGYTHTSPTQLTREQEEGELVKGLEILRSFGTEVVGYRSPSWDFSASTEEFLQRHGFAYSSNFMDDLRPYRRQGTSLVEVPISWVLDDAAHFWFDGTTWTKKISTASEVREIWEGEFRGYHQLGGAFVLTMHPQIIGRPYRLEMLDLLLRWMRNFEDVWWATCRELAERVT